MAKAAEIIKNPELDAIEHELLQAVEMVTLAKEEADALKVRYLKAMADAGHAESGRTEHFRVVTSRSSGTLDTDAVARHFGCTTAFLSRFRSRGKTTTSVRIITPKKGTTSEE